jgi:hypothetical protein
LATFIPFIWLYQRNQSLHKSLVPYVWYLTNIFIVVAKMAILMDEHIALGIEWSVVWLSFSSVLCQVPNLLTEWFYSENTTLLLKDNARVSFFACVVACLR